MNGSPAVTGTHGTPAVASTTGTINLGGDIFTNGDVTLGGIATISGSTSKSTPRIIATNGHNITFNQIGNKGDNSYLQLRADLYVLPSGTTLSKYFGTSGLGLTQGSANGGRINGQFLYIYDLTVSGAGGHLTVEDSNSLYGSIYHDTVQGDDQAAFKNAADAMKWKKFEAQLIHTLPNPDVSAIGGFTFQNYKVTGKVIDPGLIIQIPDPTKARSGESMADMLQIVSTTNGEITAEIAGFSGTGPGKKGDTDKEKPARTSPPL